MNFLYAALSYLNFNVLQETFCSVLFIFDTEILKIGLNKFWTAHDIE